MHLHSCRLVRSQGHLENADSLTIASWKQQLLCVSVWDHCTSSWSWNCWGDRFEEGESSNFSKDWARDSTYCLAATHAREHYIHSLYTVSSSKQFCFLEIKTAHKAVLWEPGFACPLYNILTYPIRPSNCSVWSYFLEQMIVIFWPAAAEIHHRQPSQVLCQSAEVISSSEISISCVERGHLRNQDVEMWAPATY